MNNSADHDENVTYYEMIYFFKEYKLLIAKVSNETLLQNYGFCE
jgi:hypothetical protein